MSKDRFQFYRITMRSINQKNVFFQSFHFGFLQKSEKSAESFSRELKKLIMESLVKARAVEKAAEKGKELRSVYFT